eukprot:866623-Prymnesium_polylepis.2
MPATHKSSSTMGRLFSATSHTFASLARSTHSAISAISSDVTNGMSSAAMAAAMRAAFVRSLERVTAPERLLRGTRRHPRPVCRRNGRRHECSLRRGRHTVYARQRRRAHAGRCRLPCGVHPRRDNISIIARVDVERLIARPPQHFLDHLLGRAGR